jgi:hypothetical protein
MSGDADILVQARSALLDALDALEDHRDSVVVIGAQAIYLHTGSAQVALAEATKDSDLALDVRSLGDDPRIEVAMERANFRRNPESNQPGAWVSPTGIPVDLMVPGALAGKGGRRGARTPPHASNATRRAAGLEAAVGWWTRMPTTSIGSLSQSRPRTSPRGYGSYRRTAWPDKSPIGRSTI